MLFLGIDVGGANLKYCLVSSNSILESKCVYLPVWKNKNKIKDVLKELNKLNPDVVCAVTTAEICDIFSSKVEGVKFIEDCILSSFPKSEVFFVDVFGNLKKEMSPAENFAASNWVSSATFLLKEFEFPFVLADMGSTTTDLIPCKNQILAAKTDFERLKRGELLYVGAVRTPLFHVLDWFKAPLVPEYFSVVGDALVVTGDFESYVGDTPDRRGKSVEECMQRMARQLCCDKNELGERFLKEMALAAKRKLIDIVANGLDWITSRWRINFCFACGTGDFIIKDAAKKIGVKCLMLKDIYGVSETFPAFSCAMLSRLLTL